MTGGESQGQTGVGTSSSLIRKGSDSENHVTPHNAQTRQFIRCAGSLGFSVQYPQIQPTATNAIVIWWSSESFEGIVTRIHAIHEVPPKTDRKKLDGSKCLE
jgi:hypothetical protein